MKYTKTVRASKNVRPATHAVRASREALKRRAIKADEEFADEEGIPAELPADIDDAPATDEPAEVTVDEEAAELLFEAEDVAELVAEVTGVPVDVTVDDEAVEFTVGDDVYTVTPEGDEEVVTEAKKIRKSARSVAASRRMVRRPACRVPASRVAASRRVSAHRTPASRVAASRRVSATRRPRR